MSPGGGRRGNLRVNAAGGNLNREWAEPSMAKSPEVFLTREKMRETGVDFCLDVHGDEALPYVFIAGADGIPSLTDRQKKAKQEIANAINILKGINDRRPNSYLVRTFFDAKSDEIQAIFSGGPQVDITQLVENLNRLAPTKRSNWTEIKF